METTTATFPHTHEIGLPQGNGTLSVLENGSLFIYPQSSAIEKIHYSTGNTLVVTYTGGNTSYYYREVPASVVFHLLVTDSFGKFINEHIKPNYTFYEVPKH
jgi:hypothetical protein